jgi:hypothetical protein
MTPGLAGMWLSFVSMGLMIAAAVLIMITRTKCTGLIQIIFSFIAYVLLGFGGVLMVLVVMTWPD